MADIEQFDYSVDILSVLLWEYNEATKIQRLLELKQQWYDTNHTEFWENWYHDVFDLQTATEFGLAVWAKILDVPLTFDIPASSASKVGWAFGSLRSNFNNSNFKRAISSVALLNTEQKRLVLKLKYFKLVTTGSIIEINAFLNYLFLEDYGLVYARDNYDMTISYVFTFYPTSQLLTVFENFDILPRPTGVGVNTVIDLLIPFGFEGHSNFDIGNFAPGGV